MAIILPKTPSYGTLLGNALGSGLEALAQSKMNQLQQRNLSNAFEQLLPQENKGLSAALAQLPDKDRQIAIKDILAAPRQQAFVSEILGQSPEQPNNLPQFSEKQAIELNKARQEERKISAAEQKEARKYLEPYEAAYAKGQKSLRRNRELKELALKGTIRSGLVQSILSKLGIEGWGENVDTQLVRKNLAAQAQNAGAAFNTSRLTNLDVNLYKQALGTLWNTKEGLYAIASINNLEQKAENAKTKARREIIRENKGKVPFDIEQLAEERAQPELERLAKKSMALITNATEKYQRSQLQRSKGFDSFSQAIKVLRPGETLTDNETGKVYNWQGKEVT